jgi:hypothetical protein
MAVTALGESWARSLIVDEEPEKHPLRVTQKAS